MKILQRVSFLLLVISLSFYTKSAYAQVPSFAEKIATRFDKQWINLPQEKVYIQTDKPYYSAGEEIWFKGYLVNATTLMPNALSQFIYVELISKADTVLSRVKIKRDSLGFEGHIKLNAEMQAGYYYPVFFFRNFNYVNIFKKNCR